MALFIQDRFIIIQDGITLSDALVLPKTEYEALSPAQVTSLKNARFIAHKYLLEHPPVPPVYTDQEQLEMVEEELVFEEEKVKELKKKQKDLQDKIQGN